MSHLSIGRADSRRRPPSPTFGETHATNKGFAGKEVPRAPVVIDGRHAATLRGPHLADDFRVMVGEYVERRWGRGRSAGEAAE